MARQIVRRNPSAVHDEISAALSRMEAMMRAQASRQPYRPPAPAPLAPAAAGGGAGTSVSPSRSTSAVGPATSPAPVRPIFGPVDAKGNPIVPRSSYLRSFVAPAASAPPAHGDPNLDDRDAVSYILHHGRRRTTSPPRSTLIRKLQEDLAECTFQPNAAARQQQQQQQKQQQHSNNDMSRSRDDPLASSENVERRHHHTAVYDRLFVTKTHNFSQAFAQRFPPTERAAHSQSQQQPHTQTQQPGDEKKVRSPTQASRQRDGAAKNNQGKGATPSQNASQAKTAPSAAANGIFKRLYEQGVLKLHDKSRTDTNVKSRQDKRSEASNARAMEFVTKMAHLERQREAKIQELRENALEMERRYIEGKRRELLEHVRRHPGAYHHTNAGPPAAAVAAGRRPSAAAEPKPSSTVGGGAGAGGAQRNGNGGAAGAGAGGGGNGHHTSTHANGGDNDNVHHSTTSSGVDSTMVLTPNGTWTRRPLASSSTVPPAALEDANGGGNGAGGGGGGSLAADEQNSGTTGNSPGRAARPPGVSPLPLSKLHKSSS